MEIKRSWMFVPGNRQRMIDKAMGLAVDAVMLDIEDGVAPPDKPEARNLIAEAVGERPEAPDGPARFVRINAIGHPDVRADLEAAVHKGLDGLALPKVESVETVREFEAWIADLEQQRGLSNGSVRLLVAIESPKGLLNAHAIAACSDRVVGLMFGAEDFGLEMSLPAVREQEARELLYARSAVTTAAAAAHVQAIDGVWPELNDEEGLWNDSRQARNLGFSGKSLFHPSQIEAINTVFSPTASDVEFARQLIQAFEEAQSRGEGAVAFRGQLIDKPIVDRARQTLYLAQVFGKQAPA